METLWRSQNQSILPSTLGHHDDRPPGQEHPPTVVECTPIRLNACIRLPCDRRIIRSDSIPISG